MAMYTPLLLDQATTTEYAEAVPVPYTEALLDAHDQHKEHIEIPMDDMTVGPNKENSSTTRNELEAGCVSTKNQEEHKDAFTLSFEYDTTFRAHKVAPVASSFDKILRKVYHYSLFGTYNVIVFLVGICLVMFWGVVNALTVFSQTWCLSPIVRYILVNNQCWVYPFYELSNQLFKCTNDLCRTLGAGCCRRKVA